MKLPDVSQWRSEDKELPVFCENCGATVPMAEYELKVVYGIADDDTTSCFCFICTVETLQNAIKASKRTTFIEGNS